MTRRKKLILVTLITTFALPLIVFVTIVVLLMRHGGTSPAYQHDADIVRLEDLRDLGTVIEEYCTKTGRYPFEGSSEMPLYVFIATGQQKQYIEDQIPYPHKEVDVAEFYAMLDNALGRRIQRRYDPQRVPVNKPNFYMYMITGDQYFLAVHLYGDYSFANKLGPYYSKAEISNRPIPENPTWQYEDLVMNQDFKDAVNAEMNRPGFFAGIREEQQ